MLWLYAVLGDYGFLCHQCRLLSGTSSEIEHQQQGDACSDASHQPSTTFTFSADGISRALSHQLVRHRIASYSQESQRYVNYLKLKEIPNIIPPKIAANPEALEVYNKAMEESLNAYRKMVEIGVAPEDARYIFPNAVETKIVFTMNARSLFNFFEQRCCMKAQWEIRQLAYEMLAAVRKVAPLIFKSAGAPCQFAKNPYCREDDTKCPMHQAMEKRLSQSDKI